MVMKQAVMCLVALAGLGWASASAQAGPPRSDYRPSYERRDHRDSRRYPEYREYRRYPDRRDYDRYRYRPEYRRFDRRYFDWDDFYSWYYGWDFYPRFWY